MVVSEVMVPWDDGRTVGFLSFDFTVFTSLFERWDAGIMGRGDATVLGRCHECLYNGGVDA